MRKLIERKKIPKTKGGLPRKKLFTKKKSEYFDKYVASEIEHVRYSMLQQLLGKNKIVLPQSLVEPECLPKKFNALFVKKIETVLVAIPLTDDLKLSNLHKTTLDTFQVFTLSDLRLLLSKNFEQYGTE